MEGGLGISEEDGGCGGAVSRFAAHSRDAHARGRCTALGGCRNSWLESSDDRQDGEAIWAYRSGCPTTGHGTVGFEDVERIRRTRTVCAQWIRVNPVMIGVPDLPAHPFRPCLRLRLLAQNPFTT